MNEPEKTFAAGLFSVLQPMASQYNERIKAIQISQQQLTERIDQLTEEIEACSKDATFVDVTPYVKKLQQSRNHVFKVSTTLNSISERLQKLNRQARAKYPELANLYDSQQEDKKREKSQRASAAGTSKTKSAEEGSRSRTQSDVSAVSQESEEQSHKEQQESSNDEEEEENENDPRVDNE